MLISELAERAGIPTSTLRYYERIGLVAPPARTASGYRSYDDDTLARLRFVVRAKALGLTLDQITELLPVWDGVNCGATHERISALVEAKRLELHERIRDLQDFARQLDTVRAELEATSPPAACRSDLSCCVPTTDVPVPVTLGARHAH